MKKVSLFFVGLLTVLVFGLFGINAKADSVSSTVNYIDTAGVVLTPSTPDSLSGTLGSKVTIPTPPTIPGYTCTGYNESSSSGGSSGGWSSSSYLILGNNEVLTYVYTQNPTVKYVDTTGAALTASAPVSISGTVGSKVTIPAPPTIPGYTCSGYTENSSSGGSSGGWSSSSYLILGNNQVLTYVYTENAPTIVSRTAYHSDTNLPQYQFFALKEGNRADGLYSAPFGTGSATVLNTDAKNYDKTIVYADEYVTLSNNTSYSHINLNGNWYWVNSLALSYEATENNGAGNYPISINMYNKAGEIRYEIDDVKYKDQFLQAVQQWNKALGVDVFLQADNDHPATLTITDNPNLPNTTPAQTDPPHGVKNLITGVIAWKTNLSLNTSIVGQGNLASLGTIEILYLHELGHTLGLGHTGDGGGNNSKIAAWSWATAQDNDVMWTGGPTNDQEVLTSQDIAAAQLVRTLKMYPDF